MPEAESSGQSQDPFIGEWRRVGEVSYMVAVLSSRMPKWIIGWTLRGPESLVAGLVAAFLPPPWQVLRIAQSRPRVLVITKVLTMGRFDAIKDANNYATRIDTELSRGEVSPPLPESGSAE